MGQRQPAARGGALRRAAREGRSRISARQRPLRRRRVRRRRPRAPASRVRVITDHAVPRAVREDDVHRPDRRGARATSSRRRSSCTRPGVEADPAEDGTRSGTFVVLHPTRSEVLIGGTFYAGEIKKSIFTVMNDRLPLEGVFPMHCSANVGDDGARRDLLRPLRHRQDDALRRSRALADRRRRARLGRHGVFNIEGGCYAKVIRLSRRGRARDLQDDAHLRDDPRERRRRRARRARPRRRLEDREHARRVQARADRERAADEAGRPSERGRLAHRRRVRDPAADRAADPRPGDVLLPLRLHGEARRHGDRRHRAAADVLDVLRRAVPAAAAGRLRAACSARSSTRTGRDGLARQHRAGRAGRSARATGCRSRRRAALLHAALSRRLDGVEYRTDPVFGFEVPVSVPGVDAGAARPALDVARPGRVRRARPRELARMFRDNFEKFADVGRAPTWPRPGRSRLTRPFAASDSV